MAKMLNIYIFISQDGASSRLMSKQAAQKALDDKSFPCTYRLCKLAPVELEEETVTTTRKVIP